MVDPVVELDQCGKRRAGQCQSRGFARVDEPGFCFFVESQQIQVTEFVALHDLSMIRGKDRTAGINPPCEASRENGIRSGRFCRLLAAAVSLFLAAGIAAAREAGTNGAAADGTRPPFSCYRPLLNSSRAVLIAYGTDESAEAWAPIADSLQRSGFHVLVVDLGGAEVNATTRAARRDRNGQRATDVGPVMDGQTALWYLRDLPDAKVQEVTLVGSGSGCSAFLGIPEIDCERFSLVLVSPRGDWQDWKRRTRSGRWDYPILVVATKDDLLSIEASAAILQEVPQQECWVVDGRGRGAELLRSRPDLVSRLTAWIARSVSAAGEEP